MLQTLEEIEAWLNLNGVKKYEITPQSEININGDVDLCSKKLLCIPVQFNTINGSFICRTNRLRSMKGCPYHVMGDFSVENNLIENFEHSPRIVHGSFNVKWNKLTSLLGIANHIKCIGDRIQLSKNMIKSGGLGLFQIEGLHEIQWGGTGVPGVLVNILRKHLIDHNNIFDCQAELIARNLEQFAQL